jgi:hypothetical protein
MNSEKIIQQWITHLSTPQENIANIPICPFSKSADYIIIECGIGDIERVKEKHELVIYVVEKDIPQERLYDRCNVLNNIHSDLIFLPDHKDRQTFINGVQTNNGILNIILCQYREELNQARLKLQKTLYYSFWDPEYLKEIIET